MDLEGVMDCLRAYFKLIKDVLSILQLLVHVPHMCCCERKFVREAERRNERDMELFLSRFENTA
jgi:hypothetical protein